MKLRMFWATMIALAVGGCEGLMDDQTAGTLSQSSSDAAATSYLVGVTMESDAGGDSKTVTLNVYRDGQGNPTCVGVEGFAAAGSAYYVKLEKRGSGEWKIGEEVKGKYDRYQRADDTYVLDVTLHWTIQRGGMEADDMGADMTNAENSRLEYLTASLNNTTLYKYQNDADDQSGLGSGSLEETNPSDSSMFNSTCSG